MRTHEGLRREQNHAWNTDAETVDHFRRFTRIHAALRPEFEALEREALRSSLPPIRHLALHFPTDPATHEISDEFLLGEDILVAPIVEEGATEREVYLPEGRWFHIWTGVEHEGPSHIVVQAPIGAPPVFSRNTDRPDLRAIE
jgi:alpha-glucosidase